MTFAGGDEPILALLGTRPKLGTSLDNACILRSTDTQKQTMQHTNTRCESASLRCIRRPCKRDVHCSCAPYVNTQFEALRKETSSDSKTDVLRVGGCIVLFIDGMARIMICVICTVTFCNIAVAGVTVACDASSAV